MRYSYFQVGPTLGQPTATQPKAVMTTRPPPLEAKVERELQCGFPAVKSKIKVNMDHDKKDVSLEKTKPLAAINVKETSVGDGHVKATTDVLMQRSTFQDENSGQISEYRNRKLASKLSDATIEEPKPYKGHKYFSDGKLISGTRQRKLWRKSTLGDDDILLGGKLSKQDMPEDERTSAR